MKRFPDGARVCFIGDSITAAYDYEARIANYYMENFPEAKVRIYNSGVAGGTVKWARTFLEDDILCHKPTHAFVMFGVNDSMRWRLSDAKSVERYDFLVTHYENYKKELRALCDDLENNGIKFTLCTPPPYAEYQKTNDEPLHGGHALIAGYAESVRELARERKYPLCDVHSYITRMLQAEDLYNDDHIHPNAKGQYYIAKCMLEFQGLDLGEMKPVPESFAELKSASSVGRDILGTELMIIRDYALPTEEKLAFIKSYLDEDKASIPVFKRFASRYYEFKNEEQKYKDLVEKLTDELMG